MYGWVVERIRGEEADTARALSQNKLGEFKNNRKASVVRVLWKQGQQKRMKSERKQGSQITEFFVNHYIVGLFSLNIMAGPGRF